MATVIGSSGLTYDRVRAILEYSVSTTNTKVTYSLRVGGHGYGSYSTSAALNTSLSCSGQTTYTTSGQGGDFSSGTNVWLNPTSGYRTYSWSRTTSKQTKTIYFSLTSTGSTISGTSSGSLTVTIPALPTYTVKYNANGGSGAPSSQTKTYGKTLTLTSSKPTRTGYTFSKWNTNSSGTGTDYSSGGSYKNNAAVTLYAKWTANTYTLTYNANGGTVSPTSKTITFGGTYGTLPTPTRVGYTFDGWYTAASGGTAVSSSTSVSTTGNRTIYAHWTPITYSITYNYDGGSVESDNPSSYTPDTASFTLNNPTRQYYNFIGWAGTNISASTTEITIEQGSIGDREYTALWERAYIPPSLTINVSKRVNQNHDDDDSGTIPHIEFTWTNGDDGGITVVTPTTYDIILTNQDDPTDVTSVLGQSLSASPTKETVYLDNNPIIAEKRCTVEVILHIPNISGQTYPDVTATDYISEAYFIIDINADGTAIGFGQAVDDNDEGVFAPDMSGQEVSDFIDNLAVTGKQIVDYIVEEGVNGDVSYRKWQSGIAECWLRTTQNVAFSQYASSSIYIGKYEWTFPIEFTYPPVVTCSEFKYETGASWGYLGSVTTTTAYLRGGDIVARAAGSCTITAYAIGRWE